MTARNTYYIGFSGFGDDIWQISGADSTGLTSARRSFERSGSRDDDSKLYGGATWMPWLSPCLNVRTANTTRHCPPPDARGGRSRRARPVALGRRRSRRAKVSLDTPARVVKAFEEFFSGYRDDATGVLSRVFEEVHGYDDIILVRDIPFSSHCEHHMVPFFGIAHVAYYPSETWRRRTFQICAARGCLRAAPANAGGADRADRRAHRLASAPARLRRHDRGRSICACPCAAFANRARRLSRRSSLASSATIPPSKPVS